FFSESGGPAALAGVMISPIPTATGIFDGEMLETAMPLDHGPYTASASLVSVENTANMGGGRIWSDENLNSVLSTAERLNLKTHLDGARLVNASVASKKSMADLARGFHTVTLCLSKGLGCPTGAVLAFDKSQFKTVRLLKQRMGGALRQSGVLAA